MSCDRDLREIPRVDYKETRPYNRVQKLPVNSPRKLPPLPPGIPIPTKGMATVEKEVKVRTKVKRFMADNDFDLFFDDTEIDEAIREFSRLVDSFEDVHVELKGELGDQYAMTYGYYDDELKGMTDWVKVARLESKGKKVSKASKESEDDMKRQKDKLRTEEKYLRDRITRELETYEHENSSFVEDIEKNVISIQELENQLMKLFGQIHSLGEDFSLTFGDYFAEQSKKISDFVKRMKTKVQDLKTTEQNDVFEKQKILDEEKSERIKTSKIHVCESLRDHVSERIKLLKEKCIKNFSDILDHALLEEKKELKTLDSEFSEILDRIVKLGEANPSEYDETSKFLTIVTKEKDDLKICLEGYKLDLCQEISNRDLTEEKVKNANVLGVQLQKFKGYSPTLDYYTFRSEFEKLIVPYTHKSLLADLLKTKYLEGQALQIVKEITDIDKIWERLKQSFGNVNTLLSNKLKDLEKGEKIWKITNDKKLVQSLTRMRNNMIDLTSLASEHSIENSLYHNSNLTKIFGLIGRDRQARILKKSLTTEFSDKQMWAEIVTSLEYEIRVKEQMMLYEVFAKADDNDKKSPNDQTFHVETTPKKCTICDKTDHVPTITTKGNSIINYYACEKFAKMSAKNRFYELKKKNLCFQCLTPGYKAGHGGTCFDKYNCPNESHQNFGKGLHILICEKHKDEEANKLLLEAFKEKYITFPNSKHREFSKNIAFHVLAEVAYSISREPKREMAIFMFQTIKVGTHLFNLFYDSGCGDAVSRKAAIDKLKKMKRAQQTSIGPLALRGVGDVKVVTPHGRYKVMLPLFDGTEVEIEGVCFDSVTSEFPTYPLGEVQKDVHEAYVAANGDVGNLPVLPEKVGGATDLMIGVENLWLFPQEKLVLPNGLRICESMFANSDGSRGVVYGPHSSFSDVHRNLGTHLSMNAYITQAVHDYNEGYKLTQQCTLLSDFVRDDFDVYETSVCRPVEEVESVDEISNSICEELTSDDSFQTTGDTLPIDDVSHDRANDSLCDDSSHEQTDTSTCDDTSGEQVIPSSKEPLLETSVMSCSNCTYWVKKPEELTKFEAVESAGTITSYRCPRCRGCQDCKMNKDIELMSVEEEVEQHLIESCVKVNLEEGYTVAKLPFICDPALKLAPNMWSARKIYDSQLRKLNANPKNKLDVLDAERKLHDLGYVAFYDDLTVEQQKKIDLSEVKYVMPWLAVWNKNSVTTKCRPVWNASHPTPSGFALNDTLAKGRNNLNNLAQIFVRWRLWRFAFHSDVQKMYNSLRLREEDWAYQLYFWDSELNPANKPKLKAVKTVIYGVKPSGNLAERGLRETANLQKDMYPRVNEIIQNDCYVDDCCSGQHSEIDRIRVSNELVTVLKKGGFILKGFTFSGFDPPEHLRNPDGCSINTLGEKWNSKEDTLSLNIGEVQKKVRFDLKSAPIPDRFRRRDCAGRVGQIFDVVGFVAPLIGGLKLDLSKLAKLKIGWDDFIPDNLVEDWKINFEMISQLGDSKFKRAIVPEDAVNLDMDTIELSDASLNLACSEVYGRFKRKNGTFSCQLLFSRTKIIPDGFTIPRAELVGAVLNATTGHIVYLSLKDYIKDRISLIDNQIVLYWINNRRSELKSWVRNRVVEVTRLTNREKWFFIDTENNISDLGTRKGAKMTDVDQNSPWINGPEWAKGDVSEFPIKSVKEIKLSSDEIEHYKAELVDGVLDEKWINQQISQTFYQSYAFDPFSEVKAIETFSSLSKTSVIEIQKRYDFSKYVLDPNKFRFRKIVRILGLVYLFISNLMKRKNKKLEGILSEKPLPDQFNIFDDRYLVTQGAYGPPLTCPKGLVIKLSEEFLMHALTYYFRKGTAEIKQFSNKNVYNNISKEKNGILYFTGRILPSQAVDNDLKLADVCIDLSSSTFCAPLLDKYCPVSFAVINEVHWYNDDARHSGNESVMRAILLICHIIDGMPLVRQFRWECPRCRFLRKKAIDVAMGPVSDDHLRIAPPFYTCQVDLFGPFDAYSIANKRATVKIWFSIFCCCVTGGVDIKVMGDYSTTSFVLAFIRFSCKVGYPHKLLPDAGSQLVKACESMKLVFTDMANQIHEHGVKFEVCPTGAHYMHGKVERKIRSVRETFAKQLQNHKLSIIQWETLGDQVANTINNLPIATRKESCDLENIDLLTPNRLMLARNNCRGPVGHLKMTGDLDKIIKRNEDVFSTWFKAWMVSYVPGLIIQPKWFNTDRDPKVGDVILFLKSDKEFEKLYQYGIISDLKVSRDGKIRQVEITYQNSSESTKRTTLRGTREVVVIHQADELGLIRELNTLAAAL